jgi:hypothetical protein
MAFMECFQVVLTKTHMLGSLTARLKPDLTPFSEVAVPERFQQHALHGHLLLQIGQHPPADTSLLPGKVGDHEECDQGDEEAGRALDDEEPLPAGHIASALQPGKYTSREKTREGGGKDQTRVEHGRSSSKLSLGVLCRKSQWGLEYPYFPHVSSTLSPRAMDKRLRRRIPVEVIYSPKGLVTSLESVRKCQRRLPCVNWFLSSGEGLEGG